jgi:hypothetical protein
VLLSVPGQRRAPVTEQAKVDLRPHVQSHNIEEISPGTVGDATHLFMVRRPLLFRLLLELRRKLLDLRPCPLAILQEQSRVEIDAAGDLKLCGVAMLVANLVGLLECGIELLHGSDVTHRAYLVGCSSAFDEQHLADRAHSDR